MKGTTSYKGPEDMDLTGKMFHSQQQEEHLRDYFVSPVGAVDWQQRMAGVVLPAAVEERNGSETETEDKD